MRGRGADERAQYHRAERAAALLVVPDGEVQTASRVEALLAREQALERMQHGDAALLVVESPSAWHARGSSGGVGLFNVRAVGFRHGPCCRYMRNGGPMVGMTWRERERVIVGRVSAGNRSFGCSRGEERPVWRCAK